MNKYLENIIQEKYGIAGEITTLPKRLFFRKNYLHKSDDNKTYLIKTYPLSKNNELEVLSYFFKRFNISKFEYQRAVVNKNGEYFFLHKGMYFGLYNYYNGRVVNLSVDNFYFVGEYIKKFHRKFGTDVHKNSKLILNDSKQIIKFCERKLGLYKLGDFFITDNPDINILAFNILEEWKKLLEINMTIIHGDCTLSNLIVNENEFVLIDFDDVRLGNTSEDVANMINSIYFSSENEIEFQRISIDLINGYCNGKASDMDILNLLTRALALKEICIHLDNYKYLIRNPNTKKYLNKLFKIFENNKLVEVDKIE